MKTRFHAIGLLLALTSTISCKNEAGPQGNGQNSGNVKLTQNGTVVTEFQNAQVSAIGGGAYVVTISSPDTKHTLVLSIEGQSAATYPFITSTETLTSGKANFLYQSYALPEVYAGTAGILIPDTGGVELTTATKTRCAGMFKGNGKNMKDGKTYTLEGAFDSAVIE